MTNPELSAEVIERCCEAAAEFTDKTYLWNAYPESEKAECRQLVGLIFSTSGLPAEVERLKGDVQNLGEINARLEKANDKYDADLRAEIARLQGELAAAKRAAIYALDSAGGRLLTLDNMQHPDIPSNRDVLDIVKNTMNDIAKDSQT